MSDSIFAQKFKALKAIDAAADAARRIITTDIAGQAETYAAKKTEAQAYIAAHALNPLSEPGPYIAADVSENGGSPLAKANAIVAASNTYSVTQDPILEAKRTGGKSRVRAATTAEDIEAEKVAAVSAIEALVF